MEPMPKFKLEVDTVILSPVRSYGLLSWWKMMTMKVVLKETYHLLAAQIIGYKGVDKRIDVLATTIHAEAENKPIERFGSHRLIPLAKDPINGRIHDRQYSKGTLKQ